MEYLASVRDESDSGILFPYIPESDRTRILSDLERLLASICDAFGRAGISSSATTSAYKREFREIIYGGVQEDNE